MDIKTKKLSLVNFSVENYRIFNRKVSFSMAARKMAGKTFNVAGENLLKTGLIFGENASGKSSLVKAISVFQRSVATGVVQLSVSDTCRTILDAEKRPIAFTMVFAIDNQLYEYGFGFQPKPNVYDSHVASEKFVKLGKKSSDDIILFQYEKELKQDGGLHVKHDYILSENFQTLKPAIENPNKSNELLLRQAKVNNTQDAVLVMDVIKSNLLILFPDTASSHLALERSSLDPTFLAKYASFLKRADFSIDGFANRKVKLSHLPPEVSKTIEAFTSNQNEVAPEEFTEWGLGHLRYTENGAVTEEKIIFNLANESEGTSKYLGLTSSVLDVLERGMVFIADEFDANLHPKITQDFVNLFQTDNHFNAQFIGTAHDATLLDDDNLTRYNIWFTKRDKKGSTELYSLDQFTELRHDKNYMRDYLNGVFGAVPKIGKK